MLLLQAERDELLKPLLAVTGVVERRHTLPILSNVLITYQAGTLTLLATDLEIQIATKRAVSGGEDRIQITTSARKLLDILRALPDHATVKLEVEPGKALLRSGKSRFTLQTLPAEDFPLLAINEEQVSKLSLPQRDLKQLLAQVQYAMAHQDIRYYLNGMLLVADQHELRLVATDGHRLAMVTHTLDQAVARADLILPRKTVLELAKQLSDSDDPVEIVVAPNQIRFSFNGVDMVSKVVDGKFPDYNRVVPDRNDKVIELDRHLLHQALQRVAILANEKFRGVRLVLMNQALKIICTNSEQEEAQEELEVDYAGDALDIGFNITYLLEVVNNSTCDHLLCSFGDANSSALITRPNDTTFKYVVMPMRI